MSQFVSVYRVECRKLLAQVRVRWILGFLLVAPWIYIGLILHQDRLPLETLYGRYLKDTGYATPLAMCCSATRSCAWRGLLDSPSYAQSLQRQGKPVERPKVASTVCHNSTNLAEDSGPGSWGCEIKYSVAGGKPQDDSWLALVDALGCYQAFTQDDAKRYREITDVYSHKRILDPAGSFDGCYDVFDHRTGTSKK